MTGKKSTAPCGHPGTCVTPRYVTCDVGCDATPSSDGAPEFIDLEITEPLCGKCGSADVAIYPGFCFSGKTLWHCNGCGKSFEVDS